MLKHVGATTFGMMTLSITALCLITLIIKTVGIATLGKTKLKMAVIKQRALKNVNNCFNKNTSSYLETSGGQSYNLYLNLVHFFDTSVN